jgi:predicted metal-dependent phosphoesterase TrpH
VYVTPDQPNRIDPPDRPFPPQPAPNGWAFDRYVPEVDLHCHSTASDGTFAPADVVRLAHAAGLTGLSLTDHDTVAGVPVAAAEAARLGVDFLSGIEVSCAFPRPGTMHMLAYGFDPDAPAMRSLAARLADARAERTALILARLRAVGVDLPLAEVLAEAGGSAGSRPAGSVGRPHVAAVLVRRGHAASTREAFDRFLGGGGSAYVDANPLPPADVIALVRAAGGLCSLAHPFQTRRRDFAQLAALVRELADDGMEGLETIHGSHDTDAVHRLTRLADRLDLVPTGGSDFHGANKPWIKLGHAAGGRVVPRAWFDEVRRRTWAGGGRPAGPAGQPAGDGATPRS